MTLETTILKYQKQLRIALFICLCLTFFAMVGGAFYELYHPDSPLAKQLLSIANTMMYVLIVLALPLLYLKIKSFESWQTQHENDDTDDKRKAVWEIAKPFLKEAMIAVIVFIIVMFLFNYFNLIPQETIDSYKQYYLNKKIFG